MLKRTMILLGLTITVGALLLVVGCGGANNPLDSTLGTSSGTSRSASEPSAPMVSIGVNLQGEKFVLFRAIDPNGDQLRYQVTLRGASDFVFDQTISTDGFSKPIYKSGEWGAFKVPKNLPPGTYTVYVQAYDGKDWGPKNNHPRYLIQ